jgi:hypothetical protein
MFGDRFAPEHHVPPLTGLAGFRLRVFPPLPLWATVCRPFRTHGYRKLTQRYVKTSDAATSSTFSHCGPGFTGNKFECAALGNDAFIQEDLQNTGME